MANVVKHKFTSAKPDSGDSTLVSSTEWNDEHAFAGGSDGQVLERDTGATDGAAWTSVPTLNGVQFPASQVASGDANTLDDYEEGTWTPTLTCATPGNLTVAYTTRTGAYTKIGRKVSLHFVIVTSTFTHTTASGAVSITGMGFTAANVNHVGELLWAGITKANYTQHVVRTGGSTALDIVGSGSGQALSVLAITDMPTGGSVTLAGSIEFFV